MGERLIGADRQVQGCPTALRCLAILLFLGVASIVLLAVGCTAEAKGLDDTEAAVAPAESFMETIASEAGVQGAFDKLMPGWC